MWSSTSWSISRQSGNRHSKVMSQTELPVSWLRSRARSRRPPPRRNSGAESGAAEAAVGAEGEPALREIARTASGSGRTIPYSAVDAGVVELDPKALLPYSAVASKSVALDRVPVGEERAQAVAAAEGAEATRSTGPAVVARPRTRCRCRNRARRTPGRRSGSSTSRGTGSGGRPGRPSAACRCRSCTGLPRRRRPPTSSARGSGRASNWPPKIASRSAGSVPAQTVDLPAVDPLDADLEAAAGVLVDERPGDDRRPVVGLELRRLVERRHQRGEPPGDLGLPAVVVGDRVEQGVVGVDHHLRRLARAPRPSRPSGPRPSRCDTGRRGPRSSPGRARSAPGARSSPQRQRTTVGSIICPLCSSSTVHPVAPSASPPRPARPGPARRPSRSRCARSSQPSRNVGPVAARVERGQLALQVGVVERLEGIVVVDLAGRTRRTGRRRAGCGSSRRPCRRGRRPG